jgi:hypothetical protein
VVIIFNTGIFWVPEILHPDDICDFRLESFKYVRARFLNKNRTGGVEIPIIVIIKVRTGRESD